MELNSVPMCFVCHKNVLPEYYFCPNCGNNLHPTPLSTSIESQILLYSFSLILPMICFLFVTKWKGLKYLRSKDQKTKRIGIIACVILAVSFILAIYSVTVWTQNFVQSSLDSINTDFNF